MKRFVLRLALCIAAAVSLFGQQQFPSLEKGFQPDRLYQFGDIDNVNVFNGNLTIVIPVGLTYPLSGDLAYQLRLSYNSNIWDQEPAGPGITHAIPARRSNAGIGWVLGMGRFVPHAHPSNLGSHDLYEAADGGDHRFDGGGGRTTDGSNLRLRIVDASTREIDFPDGTIHQFKNTGSTEWELRQIRNWKTWQTVTIQPVSVPSQCSGDSAAWQITDSLVRAHYICSKNMQVDSQSRLMVHKVVLDGPQGQAAVYDFEYSEDVDIAKPPQDNDPSESWPLTHDVPLLTAVNLPDGSRYEFAYDSGGKVQRLTLPTRGVIEYAYTMWDIPSLELCANVNPTPSASANRVGRITLGVETRTFIPAVVSGQTQERHTWTYSQKFKPDGGYTSAYDCSAEIGGDPVHPRLWDEVIVEVRDPDGDRVDNHFSVWVGDINTNGMVYTSPGGFEWKHFSLPQGPRDAAQNRYLSQEFFDCTGASCPRRRSVFVRHDMDSDFAMAPHRLASQSTYFEEGTPDCGDGDDVCWRSVDSTDFDGYGHYRVETRGGNFGNDGDGPRTTTTSWNKTAGQPRTFGAGDRWILNTHEGTTTSEGSSTTVEQACFDTTNGFLRARRLLAGTSPATNDLFSRFTMDANGNLVSEKHYGGDHALLPTAANTTWLCDALAHVDATTPVYALTYTWQNGRMATSQYSGASFLSADLTIDRSGLATLSRDPALRQTAASYDSAGRIISLSRPGLAETTYTYTNAQSTITPFPSPTKNVWIQPASASQTMASLTGSGTARAQFQFDSFGRIWREKKGVATDTQNWSVRETLYDADGNRKSVSEFESLVIPGGQTELHFVPAYRTLYEYDVFSRVKKITPPDDTPLHDTETTMTYAGGRRTTRTQNVATTTTIETPVSTTEVIDAQERLAEVIENSGSTTGQQLTTYRYDAGGRLRTVTMGSQTRSFTYDGRGLLLSETHPESGLTTYTSDARGHVRTTTTPVAALTHAYDFAERPTAISQGGAPVTEFHYDRPSSGTDYSMGKLDYSVRHNQHPDLGGDIQVRETLFYENAGGRLSKKTTTVTPPAGSSFAGGTFTEQYTWDDLGDLKTVTYPSCDSCGGFTPPARTVTSVHSNGFLTAVSGYASSIGYHANDMVHTVQHLNAADPLSQGPLYTQTLSNGMARPGTISVSGFCSNLSISTQPQPQTVAPGTTVQLSLGVNGATTVDWYSGTSTFVGSGNPRNVLVSATTTYWARVRNASCFMDSEKATITVSGGSCTPPDAAINAPPSMPAGSPDTASVTPTTGATYTWTIQNGTFTSANGASSINFTAACSGSVVLGLTVSTSPSCSSTSSKTIPVVLSAAQLGGPYTMPSGGSVQITATLTGSGPWLVKWTDQPGSFTTTSPVQRTVTPASTTTYTLEVLSDARGCLGTSGQATVVVSGGSCSFDGPSTVAAGGLFTVTFNPGEWTWTYTNAILQTLTQNTLTLRASCGADVVVTQTANNQSCSLSKTVQVIESTAQVSGSTQINPGQSATLTVSLTGTPPWNLTWTDNFTQTHNPPPPYTQPATRTVTPSATTTYQLAPANGVQDGNNCYGIVGGSATVTVATPPPAPTNLQATYVPGTGIQVSWSYSGPAVDRFDLYRNGAFLQSWSTTSFPDGTVLAGNAYWYFVRAVKSGAVSADSNREIATVMTFTGDDPVIAQSTAITAAQVTQLRTAVNAVRAAVPLTPFSFSGTAASGVPVTVLHINQLRAALDEARQHLLLPPIGYERPSPLNIGDGIHARDINDLRGGVK